MTPRGLPYAIDIESLRYSWPGQHELLSIASLKVMPGHTVLLQGASGSGKTTLLSLMTGVLASSQGQLRVLGHDLTAMQPAQRDILRGECMGVIFQLFNLLPFLSVIDNVILPLRLFPKRRESIATPELMRAEALRLLSALGLPAEIQKRQAHQLSVGQQQRVAAARALIGKPPLIIADEPTSALDEASQQDFLSLLITQVKQTEATLFMVSHDSRLAPEFDQVVRL